MFRTEHICESDVFPLKIMCLQFAPHCLENAHKFCAMRSADATHICEPYPLKTTCFQMFSELDANWMRCKPHPIHNSVNPALIREKIACFVNAIAVQNMPCLQSGLLVC